MLGSFFALTLTPALSLVMEAIRLTKRVDLSESSICEGIVNIWKRGEEVDTANELGETALTVAVDRSTREKPLENLIALLLGLGLDINVQTNRGETPLIKSIKAGMKEKVMRLLLESGAEIHRVDEDGLSFLDYLDQVGCYASFDYNGSIRYWRRSTLLKFIWEGKTESVNKFAKELHATASEESALHDALMMMNRDIPNPPGWSLLHAAVFLGKTRYVRIILEHLNKEGRVDWCFKLSHKKLQTALTIACAKGFVEIVCLFRDIIINNVR